jgi:hypothetical protein
VNANGTLASNLGLFNASSGNQYVILNGIASSISLAPLSLGVTESGNFGTLAQTFNTVAGRTYQISFNYRGLAVGLLTNNPTVDVGVTNAMGSTAPGNGTLAANISLGAWQSSTFSFVATGSSSTLSFFQDSTGGGVGVLGIDNVALTPLPEPSQYGAAAVAFLTLVIAGRAWSRRGEKVEIGT